jgi:hypothetical protein
MFNVECIVKPSILIVVLLVNAMRTTLVLVKLEDMYLLYNHNNP